MYAVSSSAAVLSTIFAKSLIAPQPEPVPLPLPEPIPFPIPAPTKCSVDPEKELIIRDLSVVEDCA